MKKGLSLILLMFFAFAASQQQAAAQGATCATADVACFPWRCWHRFYGSRWQLCRIGQQLWLLGKGDLFNRHGFMCSLTMEAQLTYN